MENITDESIYLEEYDRQFYHLQALQKLDFNVQNDFLTKQEDNDLNKSFMNETFSEDEELNNINENCKLI